jgi:hypothetical protein
METIEDSFHNACMNQVSRTYQVDIAKRYIDGLSLEDIDELVNYAMAKAEELEKLKNGD